MKPECANLCSHIYLCSCRDRSSLCKHVHKVHSFICRNYDKSKFFENNLDSDDDNCQPFELKSPPDSSSSILSTKTIKEIVNECRNLWGRIDKKLDSKYFQTLLLPEIHGFLKDIDSASDGITEGRNDPQLQKMEFKITPHNKKLDKQVTSFHAASKHKFGGKKKYLLLIIKSDYSIPFNNFWTLIRIPKTQIHVILI